MHALDSSNFPFKIAITTLSSTIYNKNLMDKKDFKSKEKNNNFSQFLMKHIGMAIIVFDIVNTFLDQKTG